jgi:heme/copper-type cytochrome/quinol oxidase subunit 2
MRRKRKQNEPGIFTPWKLVGAALTLGLWFLWAYLVTVLVPDEIIPRVENQPDGSTSYHLQSLAEAVLGATMIPVLGIIGFFVLRFAARKQLERHGLDPTIDWSQESRLGIVILAILAIMFLCLVFISVVIVPATNLRTVTTRADSIEFHSLYWSWTITRTEVDQANLTRRVQRGRGGEPLHDVHLVVTTKSGARYETMASDWAGYGVEPEELADHLRVLEALKRDLEK